MTGLPPNGPDERDAVPPPDEPMQTGVDEQPPESGGDRVPPHSLELEMNVLGAMLLSRQAVSKMSAMIDETAFYRGRHQQIFKAVVGLFESQSAIDLPLIAEALERKGILEECGGTAYLADVAASVGTSVNCGHHAKLLLEKSARRKLIALASQAVTEGYESGDNIYESLEILERELFELAHKKTKSYKSVGADIAEAYALLEDRIDGKRPEFITGWENIDKVLEIYPGSVNCIAADTGCGKSTFLMNLATYLAGEGKPVGWFSLEMKRPQIQKRLIKSIAQVAVDFDKKLPGGLITSLGRACTTLESLPIYIDDSGGLSPREISARIRRMVHEKGVRTIIFDYIQLVSIPGYKGTRADEIGAFTSLMKQLATELNIPFFVASQLNRESSKQGRPPELHDLLGSGDIERDCDTVSFIWGKRVPDNAKDVGSGRDMLFFIKKQRDGENATLKLRFIGNCHTFKVRYGGEDTDGPTDADVPDEPPYLTPVEVERPHNEAAEKQ